MNINKLIAATAVAAVGAMALTVVPAIAHHASAPFYDAAKRVEISGTITRVVFRNPHAAVFVDATDASGQRSEWQIELGAPASLARTGWTAQTLTAGTMIKAAGQPSKAEGTHGMCCARITKPDGSPIVPGGRVQEEVEPPR